MDCQTDCVDRSGLAGRGWVNSRLTSASARVKPSLAIWLKWGHSACQHGPCAADWAATNSPSPAPSSVRLNVISSSTRESYLWWQVLNYCSRGLRKWWNELSFLTLRQTCYSCRQLCWQSLRSFWEINLCWLWQAPWETVGYGWTTRIPISSNCFLKI